ncbi:TPA: LysR family transcriptional regulator [Klebsiella pneumoniae]|nr:LysR family transcriptional regulator [Klebsiella pneumoniae]STX14720.1 LysR family transcriptional regulator [Klebsiella pneumoniae]HCI6085728.1 LysR family transcriptional regulator [Klebsiella pneumoniae]
MNLSQLTYFIRIAELGNISKAALDLHISQPSLSASIAKLEDELGVPLLSRQSRGVLLTGAGQEFLTHARRVLADVDLAIGSVQLNNRKFCRRIRVACSTSMTKAISEYIYDHLPSGDGAYSLNIVEAMPGHIPKLLRDNLVDIAIVYEPTDALQEMSFRQYESTLSLIASRGHDLYERDQISFGELEPYRFVLPSGSHPIRTVVNRELLKRQLSLDIIDCDSLPAMEKLMLKSGFITIMPSFGFCEAIEEGSLRSVAVVDSDIRWDLAIVVDPMQNDDPSVISACEILHHGVEEALTRV